MPDTEQARSRRTLIGLCTVMGVALMVVPSFNYMLTPMLADLGLTQEEASTALSIPSIASLLVVFIAGRLGDRRGHRTVITAMGVAFILGSALVMVTQGLTLLVVGLLIEGIGATAIQIVVIGLLSDQFSEPRQRAAAFGTFGMVSPFVWLLLPVLTGVVVRDHSWRLVPAIWVVCGLLMVLAARLLLPGAREVRPVGEMRTPVLAGATVVLAVQALSRAGDDGVTSAAFLVTAGLTVVVGATVLLLLRRASSPSFSLAPLRARRARLLLVIVIVIPLINTVFLMTMAFQYLYGLTVLQTALVMVPAQAAAMLGTRYLAAPLMKKIGVTRTAALLFGVLSVAMLTAFFITPTSPLWVPATYVAIYNVLTVAASITVVNGLMSTATTEDSGLVSAYRGAGVALGAVLAVVVMNTVVFALSRLSMEQEFVDNGMTTSEATDMMAQVQQSSTSTAVMSQYATPLPSGTSVDAVLADTIATGLHINAVLGSLLALACVGLILRSARPTGAK